MAVNDCSVPPGWEQNPSAWAKRCLLAGLAAFGLAVSTYLALYQLHVLGGVWDPFFADGSRAVLKWTKPVPDAAFGVAAYTTEVVITFIGGHDRWRTMPWTVMAFGAVTAVGARRASR